MPTPKPTRSQPAPSDPDPAAPAVDPERRHRNLPHLLLRAREALMAEFRPLLAAHGLTEQQWRILRELLERGPREPRQLGESCLISSPSLVGVLARMEESGWVRRERMTHDQRRLMVTPTPSGRRLGRRLIPAIEARYAAIEAALGIEALQGVYDALDALLTPNDA